MPVHQHPVWELNQLQCGEIEYEVCGERGTLSAGECIFIPPHTPHVLLRASAEAALWVLELGQSLHAHSVGSRPLGDAFVTQPPLEYFRAVSRSARRLWLRPRGEELARATAAALELLAHPPAGVPPRPPAPVHPAVTRARRICEQLSDAGEVAIDEIARRAGISGSRLSHLFQEQVGITPLQYRNYCKVQEFVRRWDGTERSLLQVALEAGFGSYPRFHRVFSQVCGAPPREHVDWLAERHLDPRVRLGAEG
jgi:AraC-like DNA-binding protein